MAMPCSQFGYNNVYITVADPGGGTGGHMPPLSVSQDPYLASPRIYACGSHGRADARQREL